MTPVLLDSNVLIALTVADHVHHEPSQRWLAGAAVGIATCPITEGSLIRYLVRSGTPPDASIATLDAVRRLDLHTFWPDDVPFDESVLDGVVGHRQVTDAYLVALARRHGSVVVTLDRGLAMLHPDHVVPIRT